MTKPPDQSRTMPRKEKATALLGALTVLADAGQQPTMRELAYRSQVGLRDAKWTMANLVRTGHVEVKSFRRVPYRNKPVAEYGFPESRDSHPAAISLAEALNAWRM